ncbi:MAG: fimbrillin family protein [Prevotellaceae bacterium]|nr:fimbrillin family protein [Prevotellaceae bacterium]
MKRLHTIILTFAVLLTSACNSSSDIDEPVGGNEALRLETTAMSDAESSAAKTMTRAHWDDKNGNKFVWDDSSNEMAIFVKESPTGKLVPWGANKYSMAKVARLADMHSQSMASIVSNSGMLKADIQKLVVGQSPVYFFSPITDDNGSSASESGVTLALPSDFSQPASHSLTDFKEYTYIMAKSTISQVNNARIEAEPAIFKGIPAVIRFSVTNDRGSEVKIKSIEVTPNVGFPQNMKWNHSNPETLSPSDEKRTSLTASMGDGDPLGVKKSQNYYVFLFPTTNSTSATLTITASVNGSEFTYKCEVPAKTFESNKIYTWKLTIGDQSLKLGFHENEDDLIQW